MSTYDETLHPRGKNPANVGQYSAKDHADAEGVELSRSAGAVEVPIRSTVRLRHDDLDLPDWPESAGERPRVFIDFDDGVKTQFVMPDGQMISGWVDPSNDWYFYPEPDFSTADPDVEDEAMEWMGAVARGIDEQAYAVQLAAITPDVQKAIVGSVLGDAPEPAASSEPEDKPVPVAQQMARIRMDARIIDAMSAQSHVKYLRHDEYGDTREVSGTIRTGFWNEDGRSITPGDFRSAHLRITDDTGMDRFVAVRELEDAGTRNEIIFR
jgi:hypothetical protein